MSGKLNYYLKRLGIFLIAAALIAGIAGCDGYTPSEDLEIRDWYDLDDVSNNLAGNHILMNDLDSTTAGYEELASPTANEGQGWQRIGYFTGSFDGQGYEIRDLFINRPDTNDVGLFYGVGQDGIIEDIGVVNVTVIGKEAVGGLAGGSNGNVSNSYSTGNVTGEAFVGGLLGINDGSVSNSYSSGKVTGEDIVGGLVGVNWGDGTVSSSYSTGNITGENVVGGLAGGNENTVSNSYFTGSVAGNSTVGGLVGWNSGTVSDCFWDVQTSGQTTSDGGTGKTTAEMQDIATFSVAGWDIIAVALNETNPAYIWNIVNNVTYPFLSWQP